MRLLFASFRIYGHLVATYESASTRRFLLGRVDCIRSASTEALDWAKAMCQGEGANVALESDREEEEDPRKVKFSIYSVSIESMLVFILEWIEFEFQNRRLHIKYLIIRINNFFNTSVQ